VAGGRGRGAIYAEYYARLEQAGLAYPCFCTEQELKLTRRRQLNAGEPPRYGGRCANLSADEVAAKRAQGLRPTLRFRVPKGQLVEFDDLARGPQRFNSDDIGDFIVRRADGSPAFFFCNALDDALMGVTHVVRGEDHLANSPRQLLLLAALGLPAPQYMHIGMIVGADGSPLSKRHGSLGLRELREAGFLPGALVNHLARLGHYYGHDDYLDLESLAAGFGTAQLSRSPARHDDDRLLFWQRQAVANAGHGELWAWMGYTVHKRVPAGSEEAFVGAVRANVVMPEDAARWAEVLFDELPLPGDEARTVLVGAGGDFFCHALEGLALVGTDFKALSDYVKEHAGVKGKALFQPLRVALTGELHGPELGPLLALMGVERARERLQRWVGEG